MQFNRKKSTESIIKLVCSTILLVSAPLGVATADLSERIIGGQDVAISSAPSTVAMISNSRLAQSGDYARAQICGGTVIASRWVLTAAHCVVLDGQVTSPDSISIVSGSTNLLQPVNQAIGVSRIIAHPSYKRAVDGFDIALLQLQTDAMVPATPIDTQAVALDDLAYIVGWGLLRAPNDTQPNLNTAILQGAVVNMIPGNSCRDFAPLVGSQVDGTQLCAGLPKGGVDTCQGDSGGPLYRAPAQNSGQGLTLVGITSWGIGCADAGNPGVYTLASAYSDWIRQETNAEPVITTTRPPSTDVTKPDNTNNNQPVPGSNLNADGTGSGSEAAAAWYLLILLAPFSLLRRNWRRSAPCVGIIALSGACMSVQELSANNEDVMDLQVVNQPMGGKRDAIIAEVSEQWQADAACTIVKTGYGVNRRAYFLETCSFANPAAHTVCNIAPQLVEYRFFENALVQVAFEFDQISNRSDYIGCLQAQLQQLALTPAMPDPSETDTPLTLRYKLDDKQIELQVDDVLRTTVSEIDRVTKIHLL